MNFPFLWAETYYDENEKYLANSDPGWAKAALFFRTGCYRFGHSGNSQRFSGIAEMKQLLDVFKKRFENGDTLALLHAIRYCAEENMPLPTWLALGFNERFSEFLRPGGPVSLDKVFSSKELPQSGKRAAAARRDWQTGLTILGDIAKIARDHPSLDSALNAVLEQGNYGVEKTKARKLIEEVYKNQQDLLGGKHKFKDLKYLFQKK